MDQTITMSMIIQMGVLIIGLWGFIKVIKEIVQSITARHDREQSWDEMEKKIDENHADTEAKFQTIRSELFILTECMSAVLDGLKQQGCNGKVTEASENLSHYMRERAHE